MLFSSAELSARDDTSSLPVAKSADDLELKDVSSEGTWLHQFSLWDARCCHFCVAEFTVKFGYLPAIKQLAAEESVWILWFIAGMSADAIKAVNNL